MQNYCLSYWRADSCTLPVAFGVWTSGLFFMDYGHLNYGISELLDGSGLDWNLHFLGLGASILSFNFFVRRCL
jgi:hypothetical protein